MSDCWSSLSLSLSPSSSPTSKLHVCPNFSHERSSSCSQGPHHRSAPSGKIMYYYRLVVHLKKNVQPHKFFFLSCSISGKRQLSTLRRISTIKWRLPARSSAPALWGELRNQEPEDTGGGVLWCWLTCCFFVFVFLSRFKISKVIVVGDLAVGKTCLINR